MKRNHSYTVEELLEFININFETYHCTKIGLGLIKSTYDLKNSDIELVIKYFDDDRKVFYISLSTICNYWYHKRTYLIFEIDVTEKENKWYHKLTKPDNGSGLIDEYINIRDTPSITKEDIFDKIFEFFTIVSSKEDVRNIKINNILDEER